MKKIKNPGIWKLGISLLPIPILCIYIIATRTFPAWILIVGLISTAVYMALVTYYCIKQKCYAQLAQNYLALISWTIIFVIQFKYIGHLAN